MRSSLQGAPCSSLPSLPPLLPMPPLFSAPEVVLAGILAGSHAGIFSSQPPFESCSLSHPGTFKHSRTDFMPIKHKNSPFFFSMSHLLSAPIAHPKWVQTGEGGWGHKPPGTMFGVRQVMWPSGHILEPLPVRAGACGGHGGANSGIKNQKLWAVASCFAGASQDFPASSILTQCRLLGMCLV